MVRPISRTQIGGFTIEVGPSYPKSLNTAFDNFSALPYRSSHLRWATGSFRTRKFICRTLIAFSLCWSEISHLSVQRPLSGPKIYAPRLITFGSTGRSQMEEMRWNMSCWSVGPNVQLRLIRDFGNRRGHGICICAIAEMMQTIDLGEAIDGCDPIITSVIGNTK